MTTFGLVHGAYHGSRCWQPLIAELGRCGHRGLAVDLPCDNPSAGAAEHAAVAVQAFADAGDDRIVVGQLTIPLVDERLPVAPLVYLCAMLPRPGRSHDDVMREEPDMLLPGSAGGSYTNEMGATCWQSQAAAETPGPRSRRGDQRPPHPADPGSIPWGQPGRRHTLRSPRFRRRDQVHTSRSDARGARLPRRHQPDSPATVP